MAFIFENRFFQKKNYLLNLFFRTICLNKNFGVEDSCVLKNHKVVIYVFH